MSIQVSEPAKVNAKDLLMVLIVTVSWGMNYPIMKYVVNSYPPSAFRAYCFIVGFLSLGLYAHFNGISLAVIRTERWPVFKLSMFNMVGWHLPMIYGLSMLNSGRAAIIGYTMPVWALLASALLYKEKINVRSLISIALAMTAALLLAWGSRKQWGNQPLGVGVMLVAAISWGIGNAMMKNTKLAVHGIALTFWALFIAFIFFFFLTVAFETNQWAWPNLLQWMAILYSGVITFAVSYVAWFHVARKLSAVSSGLSIMLVPVFGVTGGAMVLGETVMTPDIAALFLILMAMVVVLLPNINIKKKFNPNPKPNFIKEPPMIQTRHLFSIKLSVPSIIDLGQTPSGGRKIAQVSGGEFSGDRMKGTVIHAPGGDWLLLRYDQVLVLDVRLTLLTDDGEYIYMSYRGLRHGPKEVMDKLNNGEAVDPALYYFRMTPIFETSSTKYAWLNRIVCIGTGRRESTGPIYEVYEVL